MASIGVVGSGINGLVAAHGLLQQGHAVTLYSERSAQAWLDEVPPTGTACRFATSLDLEAETGLNHWDADAPAIEGVHLTFCHKPGWQLIDLMGRLDRPARAIDVRLQSHRWTRDLEARGGRVEIERVDVPRLDAIAAAHDLVLVAAGRGDVGGLFARDEARSTYTAPPRKLTMMVVRNAPLDRTGDGIPFRPAIKFNFFAAWGEEFAIPYWHKDGFACWNLLFEGRPGGPLDAFDDCADGEQVVARAKRVFRDCIPWDHAWFRDAELADPNGWLKGQFVPCFRDPVGTLPSGRVAMALGDTANSLDPIGGQGANNGYRQIGTLLAAVAERPEGPFDAAWMRATFDRFYESSGRATNAFNNLLLEEITPAAKEVLIAQYGSDGRPGNASPQQRIADRFFNNFDDPTSFTECLLDPAASRRAIAEAYGRAAGSAGLKGRLRIAGGQLRQLVGLPRSSHPLARMRPAA
ncbi:MAG: styrene monooxygenase/indole monooxygenase family protein [Alphaproteobacteria bacterium]